MLFTESTIKVCFSSSSSVVVVVVVADTKLLWCLVWSVYISRLLKLDFKSLHPNLEPIHSLDRCLCTCGIVETDKSEAFALVCGTVNEDLTTDDIAEGEEHLHKFCISEFLRKVIDEQVATVGSAYRAADTRNREARESGLDSSCAGFLWSHSIVVLGVGEGLLDSVWGNSGCLNERRDWSTNVANWSAAGHERVLGN